MLYIYLILFFFIIIFKKNIIFRFYGEATGFFVAFFIITIFILLNIIFTLLNR